MRGIEEFGAFGTSAEVGFDGTTGVMVTGAESSEASGLGVDRDPPRNSLLKRNRPGSSPKIGRAEASAKQVVPRTAANPNFRQSFERMVDLLSVMGLLSQKVRFRSLAF